MKNPLVSDALRDRIKEGVSQGNSAQEIARMTQTSLHIIEGEVWDIYESLKKAYTYDIERMYVTDGKDALVISQELSLPKRLVSEVMKECDVYMVRLGSRWQPTDPLTELQKTSIEELYFEGKSMQDICAQLNLDATVVATLIEEIEAYLRKKRLERRDEHIDDLSD